MINRFITRFTLAAAVLHLAAAALFAPMAAAQESAPAISKQTIAELDQAEQFRNEILRLGQLKPE